MYNLLSEAEINENLVLYFKQMTEKQQTDDRNIQYLLFFRALCRYQDKAISINQEMIFKFIK